MRQLSLHLFFSETIDPFSVYSIANKERHSRVVGIGIASTLAGVVM